MIIYRVILFFGLLGICLGAGGGVSSGGSSEGGSLTETEDTKQIRVGKFFNLTCDFNATNTNTEWTKDGNKIEASDRIKLFPNSTLYISSATPNDVGEYSCKTDNMNETKVFFVVELYLRKSLPKSTTVLEDDKLSLSCQVEGNPLPSVQWLKDGEPVEEFVNSTRLTLSENKHAVPNASLLIKPVLKSDGGNYVCLISQYSLHINTTTVVRVVDIYAALWPFLGIVAEVVILCTIVLIYEKRRIRPNLEDYDNDEANNVKKSVDMKKESEVRQRK